MGAATTDDYERILRGLATNDPSLIEPLLHLQFENIADSGLDPKTHALVRLAALIAIDAAPASFAWQVTMARESGVTPQEILGVVIALAPTIGMARVVATAPELAFALDIDLEASQQPAGSR